MIGLLESQPLFALVFAVLVGSLIGSFTGLIPGVHVNTVAPIVLAVALAGGTSQNENGALWAALLLFSVATVHTILNVIPTLAAPLPEDDTALILMPVQRMAQNGHAKHALVISIIGSWIAASLAILLLLAVLFLYPRHLPRLPHGVTVFAVTAILFLLIVRQSRPWHATAILLLSGIAGMLLLPRSFPGPLGGDGTVLLPAFAGLYGAPMLVMTLSEKQAESTDTQSEPSESVPASNPVVADAAPRSAPVAPFLGTACGLLVALFPGLTSATAGAFGRALRSPKNDAEDVSMLSAVDTANVIGNTGALLVWGATRSGASAAALTAHPTIAATGAGLAGALGLASLLGAAALASIGALRWGTGLVVRLRRIPARRLALGALLLLVFIVAVAGGTGGLLVTLFLLPLGLLPHHWGAPRALLMGFLLVPYLAGSFADGVVL